MNADCGLTPGDRALVAFPRPCCGGTRWLGTVILVDSVEFAPRVAGRHGKPFAVCGECGALYDGRIAVTTLNGRTTGVHLSRLVRIPPDSEAKRLFRETEKPVAA